MSDACEATAPASPPSAQYGRWAWRSWPTARASRATAAADAPSGGSASVSSESGASSMLTGEDPATRLRIAFTKHNPANLHRSPCPAAAAHPALWPSRRASANKVQREVRFLGTESEEEEL